MSKAERVKVLSDMSAQRRENIEKGLAHLDSLPPAQRQKAIERYRAFTTLDSRQKDQIREAMQRFRSLPLRRQQVVKTEIDFLHQLAKQQRDQRLLSEEFKSRYSAEERSIMQEVTIVMPRF